MAGAIADKIEHLLYEWSQRPEGLFDGAKEAEESLSKLIDPLEKMDIGMLLCLDTELANGLVSALSHLQFLKRVLDSADEDADVWIDHRHRRALSIHLDEARQELNWVRSKIAQI